LSSTAASAKGGIQAITTKAWEECPELMERQAWFYPAKRVLLETWVSLVLLETWVNLASPETWANLVSLETCFNLVTVEI
jgi:hypothetical protein